MTVIFCLDDQNGLLFNRRRLSRDKAVSADIAVLAQNVHLRVSPYSVPLFENICVPLASEDFLDQAQPEDLCFVEDRDITPYLSKIERIIIYRWNRRYPSDTRLEPSLLKAFEKTESIDFPGNSHENITREVYRA